ncbi:restriction endonuclease subunit S [Streptomyces sp. SID9913]|uniref:restriction endonuclease subunit S n=1 Tax=Streptomyces sp. SID9913 TaxID=2706117 RepID=UPI0013D9EC85|nr:restriction endonuclease subunit S [Streptomyces sp. SID9913]NED22571.1 restriction endonuclease subunit S [Streptomyces sp. SID9913]
MSESGGVDGERELPAGWAWAELGEVADTALGKMLDKKQSTGQNPTPYLRNVNVQWGCIDTGDLLTMDIEPEDLYRFTVSKGDLVVCEGGEIGRCAIWNRDEPIAYQKALHRVRVSEALETRYLRYYLEYAASTGKLARFATGSTIKHLPQQRLREVPVPVPPLGEQYRIVETLEEQLSRIDSGVDTLRQARRRLEGLRKRALISVVPEEVPESWQMTTVEGAGTLELGRARHPDWHHGPDMRPYLRVANVFEDRIDTTDVMEMDFSGIWEKYRLEPGDVLLNEGQSPHLVGRPALYRGIPKDVAFTNSLIRFKAGGNVLPEWALLVFRRHLHAKRFMREVRITTNIAHLSAKRLKKVEFPIPPLDVQKELVQRCEESLSGIEAMDQQIGSSLKRADALRWALLRRAFTGRLVPQDPVEEPAAALLARIAAERAATPKRRRPRKAAAKTVAQRSVHAAAPEPTPAPTLAVQQEFDL